MSNAIVEIIRRLEKLEQVTRRLRARDTLQVSVDPLLRLPGLRGCWTLGAYDSTGAAQDCSGHGHHLTYNGNPTYTRQNLAPYIDLDGTGDYLSRIDEADLDITGTESYVAAATQGLTFGGWFYADTFDYVNGNGLMSKDAGDGNRSYLLQNLGVTTDCIVSPDGATATQIVVTSSVTLEVDTWYHIVGRALMSDAALSIFVNGVVDTMIDEGLAIFNSTASLEIGRIAADSLTCLDGYASHCFLCAAALSDECIQALYQQQRSLFGV